MRVCVWSFVYFLTSLLGLTKFSISSKVIPAVFLGRCFLVCFKTNKWRCIFHKCMGSDMIIFMFFSQTIIAANIRKMFSLSYVRYKIAKREQLLDM